MANLTEAGSDLGKFTSFLSLRPFKSDSECVRWRYSKSQNVPQLRAAAAATPSSFSEQFISTVKFVCIRKKGEREGEWKGSSPPQEEEGYEHARAHRRHGN